MKIITAITMLLLSVSAYAQFPYQMNDPAMQKFMEEMQKYERCMAKIQQSQFVDIQRRQEKFVEEVGPLCKSGNRGKAQKLAIQFGKDMSKHPAIVEITKCSKLLTSTMAKDELDDMDFNYESSDVHVCDEIDEMQQ